MSETQHEVLSQEELKDRLRQLELHRALLRAQNSFIPYCKLMMPHPDAPEDPYLSMYDVAEHHQLLGAALEEVERGELLRMIVVMPPRHGKTQQISKFFPAWWVSRDPYRSAIFATYNDTYAGDIGRDVREILKSERHRQIFPHFEMRGGSVSSERITTKAGGQLVFVGRGGSLTGRGAHCLIVDDPVKDDQEAQSPTVRDKMWEWFTKVAMTRLMTVGSAVVVVMTRWHEDDLVGRLTDPRNPHFDQIESKKWRVIHLPAEAEQSDILGRRPGEALWPARFPLEFLRAQKRLNPRGYSALYQGRPSPDEGAYFKANWIRTYIKADCPPPDAMRIYAASDHALGQDGNADKSCFVIGGVDREKNLWILDCWWERANSKMQVEAMLHLMDRYKPVIWWAEDGMITKSLGPYLYRKKAERQLPTTIEVVKPTQNKQVRAQSIAALMAERKVLFPSQANWFTNAKHEILQFPNGTHDDFVDALSWIGLKLLQLISRQVFSPEPAPDRGTFGWWKREMAHKERLTLASQGDGW